ncbi:MAG: DNA-directed RNA polymerase subunit alpha [bacterium]|nr:DNA-directed RNA polymerase subunit alpha [bacterium]
MTLNADLVKPSSLETSKDGLNDTFGQFLAEPLERGYGTTLGNALRRVILSSLRGAAFTAVRIEGVYHEFSTIPGVMEDVTDIILNLKDVVIQMDDDMTRHLSYKHSGSAVEFKAGDLEGSGVRVLNPEQHIATLNEEANFEIEVVANIGRGYVPAERNAQLNELGPQYIPIDAVYSPIRKCNFKVEKTRVGDLTDYDKLILDVTTDGSIAPMDAVAHAAKILKDNLQIFINFEEEVVEMKLPEVDEQRSVLIENLNRSVEELELSVRSYNCLKNARIQTIGELVQKSESEMLRTRNFGRKSLNEIREILTEMGLSLGMDLSQLNVSRDELGASAQEME